MLTIAGGIVLGVFLLAIALWLLEALVFAGGMVGAIFRRNKPKESRESAQRNNSDSRSLGK
jgi:hypothetical protein